MQVEVEISIQLSGVESSGTLVLTDYARTSLEQLANSKLASTVYKQTSNQRSM